jgi:hypothetical protein
LTDVTEQATQKMTGGMVIDGTMEVSENMAQTITDSQISANQKSTTAPKTPAPKKQQSLPTRSPNQAQPTRGVY